MGTRAMGDGPGSELHLGAALWGLIWDVSGAQMRPVGAWAALPEAGHSIVQIQYSAGPQAGMERCLAPGRMAANSPASAGKVPALPHRFLIPFSLPGLIVQSARPLTRRVCSEIGAVSLTPPSWGQKLLKKDPSTLTQTAEGGLMA
ncbi:hypothetical protein NDU88_010845 [Pleurodeles waltl]|uniref:Uncharacterized protein n=1 Tax=Pleurodeles waltl TaxID=8319 RepID=A0AAV7PZ37_PLEWA|nr:hypothetical protein NDU88_010845 [Pleurodeles waltl]